MRTHAIALTLLLSHLFLFSCFNLFITPHPDMLDHWVWSRHLALSYYEHPPMIAWAIRFITMIGGNSETTLEFGAQFYNLSILALSYAVCFQLFGKRAAIFCLILLESTPYYLLGSVFLHIDQPFLIFWLLNLYGLCRFHQTSANKWLIWIGIISGLGALSKYITILFYLGLFVHLLLYKELRPHLKNPWLYFAGSLSLLLFSPVLLWNFQNDWVSFRFQFTRGLSGAPLGQNLILFTLGHLILFSLVWSWWGFYQIWRQRKEFTLGKRSESIILVLSIVPLIFFSLMSVRGAIADPHWANVSYLGIMMLSGKTLASAWDRHKRSWIKKMVGGGGLLNLIILVAIFLHIQSPLWEIPQYQIKYYHPFVRYEFPRETIEKLKMLRSDAPLKKATFIAHLQGGLSPEEWQQYQDRILEVAASPHFDLITEVLAWEATAEDLIRLLKKQDAFPIDFIISKEFQLSSALSFYLPDHPPPYSLEKPERNQWSPLEEFRNKKAVIVCRIQSCDRVLKWTQERFQRNTVPWGEIKTSAKGRLVRHLEVFGFSH